MNARIDYACIPTSIGIVLVSSTPFGVFRIALGDDELELAAQLARDLPFATLARDDVALAAQCTAIATYVEGRSDALALPLDLRATAFRRRVWDALLSIPRGTTRSYAAVARSIGMPGATRAVAGACAANPVAIAIPCHRVIESSGRLGGYRWGVARKRVLLARETQSVALRAEILLPIAGMSRIESLR